MPRRFAVPAKTQPDPGSPFQGVSRRDLAADGAGVLLAALALHFWFR